MKRWRPPAEPDDQNRWIIPYADFITLLFAVFAVLYAISALDRDRFARMSSGLRAALSPAGVGVPPPPGSGRTPPAGRSWVADPMVRVPLAALRDRVESALARAYPSGRPPTAVALQLEERGLVISLAADALFEGPTGPVRTDALELLRLIAAELAPLDATVRVEAHADTGDAWETSAAQATAVLRALVEQTEVQPSRLSAAGYGDLRPIAPNDTGSQRERNRRVDLVVLSSRLAASEPPAARARSLGHALRSLPEPASPRLSPRRRSGE